MQRHLGEESYARQAAMQHAARLHKDGPPGLIFADVFVPDGGIFFDVLGQEGDAFLIVQVDHVHAMFAEPRDATWEILAFTYDQSLEAELADEAAAIPAGG